MSTTFTTFFITFMAILALVASVPLRSRDVFVPPVTYPRAGTVWIAGEHHNVTWDMSNAPAQITNPNAVVILATNGVLNYENPLATGNITAGRVEIQVPSVSPGSNYSIVLFGDSGNSSPTFSIMDS